MKPSGVGGMAVMEGVMMKNKDEYAVAVRKPNNEIVIEKNTHKDFSNKAKLFKLPIFRGMLAFVDSMVVGVKVLSFSASFFEDEEEQTKSDKKKKKSNKNAKAATQKDALAIDEVSVADTNNDKQDELKTLEVSQKKEDRVDGLLMAAVVLLSTFFSIGFFMLLPFFISGLFAPIIKSKFLLNLVEGFIRITIFIVYIFIISRMPEIKRFFMYHGAEHKTINCLENGFELTVENVRWQSKVHKRCGTSFMLLVMIISVLIFFLLPSMNLLWRILSRILLVPIIAGISYEFIRLAGRSDNKLVNIISKPGLWMQGLTTKEPDDAMIQVAIQSVDAVFDWRSFLETAAVSETDKKQSSKHLKKPKNEMAHSAIDEKITKEEDQTVTAERLKPRTPQSSTVDKQKPSRSHNPTVVHDIPIKENSSDDEDDDILKALDKYLDFK